MGTKATRIELVHEDTDLLAVNKPAGLSVVPGRGRESSLIELLIREAGRGKLRLVHRIDAETSGLVLLARNLSAQRCVCREFAKRRVEKEYLAIVIGRPTASRGRIEAAIGSHPRRAERMCVRKSGREAVTDWELAGSWGGFSLLRCRPLTGRRHQIRVHLAHAGMPLAVDPLYGSGEGLYLSRIKPSYRPSRRHPEYPLIGRLTLHAWSLELAHPGSGRGLRLVAEPPKDFRAAVRQLHLTTGAV